jgi:hypothetical protein
VSTDQEMMARVLKGQEHLTIEQKLRNVCESFEVVQKDNVRLYALADTQDDEIERLKKKLETVASLLDEGAYGMATDEARGA